MDYIISLEKELGARGGIIVGTHPLVSTPSEEINPPRLGSGLPFDSLSLTQGFPEFTQLFDRDYSRKLLTDYLPTFRQAQGKQPVALPLSYPGIFSSEQHGVSRAWNCGEKVLFFQGPSSGTIERLYSMLAPQPIIHVLTNTATQEQIQEMASFYAGHIKVAVDIEEEILAGGGEWHADCEKVLISQGSRQTNIWGGGYQPETKVVDFYSLINIRPKQNNPGQDIIDSKIREKFESIVRKRLEI